MKILKLLLVGFIIFGCNSNDPFEGGDPIILDTPPCFEGIWIHERCSEQKVGSDTLKITPQNQAILITPDCGNICGGNMPRTVQYYYIIESTNNQFILQNLSTVICGESSEGSTNPFPVGYECKEDTLFWGGITFLLHLRYRNSN